jgi:hypothetical protein
VPAQITALPTPPSTNDPANFNTRADAFLGQMPTFVTEANALAGEVNANAAQTAADRVQTGLDRAVAATALGSPGTNGSSTTSLTVGAGTKAFTTQTGKAWVAGQGFFLASTASPLNWMSGTITAYKSGTGAATLEVDTVGGSGTFAAWNCGLAAGRPYALASLAEAQGAVDNTKVMTPLRTVQTVRAVQTPVSITAATSLTASSAVFQVANMPARGLAVTLPDATTLQTGHGFKVVNNGPYDLPIKDGAGAIKAFARPSRTVTCTLSANGTAAGAWVFEDASIYGCTVDSTIALAGGGVSGSIFRVIALDATRDLIVFQMSSPYSLRCVVHDRASNAFGAVATIQSGVATYQVVPVNATTVLAVYGQNDTMYAATLSISGTSVTVNTPNVGPAFANSIENIFDAIQVGSLYLFRFWSSNANGEYVFAVNPYTATPGMGAAVYLGGPGNNSYDVSSCFCTFAIGTNYVIAFSAYNSGSAIYYRLISVPGVTTTVVASDIVTQDTGQTPYKVEPLSTGRYLVLFTQSSTAYGLLVTVSGSTTSQSTRLSLGGMASGAGYGFNGPASGVLVPLSGGRALCSWINTITGISNWLILTDTSGTLSASATVTRGADFQASGAVAKIGVSGNTVYLARNTTSAFAEFYAVDCSGSAPAFLDVQRISSGMDPVFGLSSYSPQNKLRFPPMVSNVLQGGAGVLGLSAFNSNGGSTPVQSVWAFNPYPRRVPMDSADGYANGYNNICAGSLLSEVWASSVTAHTLHLRRIECVV